MADSSKLVAVTGCGGFLASMLVKQLLEEGYTVRGTLRNPLDPKKTDHLKSFQGRERLSLHQADLLETSVSDWAHIFDGCEFVFHTAAPYVIVDRAGALGEDFFVKNCRDGALNVLEACLLAPSVRRVVLTSSTAAMGLPMPPKSELGHSELDWSNPEDQRPKGLVYAIGKTLAEQSVWEWMAEHGQGDPTGIVAALGRGQAGQPRPPPPAHFTLVCMNPCLIGGPMLQPELNASSEVVWQFASGSKSKIPNSPLPWVDVRDVAHAHIRAAVTPGANGRYLLMGSWEPSYVICDRIRTLLPAAPIPTEVDLPPTGELAGPGRYTTAKAENELGMKFRGLEEILAGTVASLTAHGYLPAGTV